MHLNRTYAGYGWVFKELYFFPQRDDCIFFPVGRDSFVQYFKTLLSFCKEMRTRWKVGTDFLSFPPCLPFLGMGGDKGRTISLFVLGERVKAGKQGDNALQGSSSVLGSVFMKPESSLLVYSKNHKQRCGSEFLGSDQGFLSHGKTSREKQNHHQRVVWWSWNRARDAQKFNVQWHQSTTAQMRAPVQNAFTHASNIEWAPVRCRVLGTLQERVENWVGLVSFGVGQMKEVDAREVQGIMGAQSDWKGRTAIPGHI